MKSEVVEEKIKKNTFQNEKSEVVEEKKKKNKFQNELMQSDVEEEKKKKRLFPKVAYEISLKDF